MTEHARDVTMILRTAWRRLVSESCVTERPTRASALARALGLNRKLGWQVWHAMNASDPFEMLDHLPGPGSAETVIRAARARGASQAAEDELRASLDSFAELTRRHAGDRASLAMMLAQNSRSPKDATDEEHRRLGYLASSYLWGVQARTFVMISILHPGASDDLVDIVAIRGIIDLRRLRADVPWVVARIGCWPKKERAARAAVRQPIAPGVRPGEVPLLHAFCEPTNLRVRAIPVSSTLIDAEIQAGEIGDTAAVTCMTAEVFRNLPRYRSDALPVGEIGPVMMTPCQTLVHDILVHPGADPVPPFRSAVLGDARSEGFDVMHARNMLPIRCAMERAGTTLADLTTAHVPRYRELVECVYRELRWDPEGFAAHRLILRYPIVPSQVVTSFDLPQRPETTRPARPTRKSKPNQAGL